MLNPWRYNFLDDTWSYKCGKEENSPPIPALPCVRINGSGCRLGQSVYLFCGLNETKSRVDHIDRLDLQTWSEWQQIKTRQTEKMSRLQTFVSPVSETEILIIGGKKSNQLSLDAYVFDTETNLTASIGESEISCLNFPSQTALTRESGQVILYDPDSKSKRLLLVTRDASSGTALTEELKLSDAVTTSVP